MSEERGGGANAKGMTDEDRARLEGDLGRLGEFGPHEWEPGELEEGKPVRYVPGVGLVVGKWIGVY